MKWKNFLLVLLISFLGIMTCDELQEAPAEPEFQNPTNPDDFPDDDGEGGDTTGFIAPSVSFINAPGEGEIIDDHVVEFSYEGIDNVVEYQFQLNDEPWSAWTTQTLVRYEYLDDGAYVFRIRGRYNEATVQEIPMIRNFVIDDIHGPALKFLPRKIITPANTPFFVDVVVEDVTDMMGVYIELPFSGSPVELLNYNILEDESDFLLSNGGNVVSLIENVDETLKLNIAVSGANPAGLSQTGSVIRLELQLMENQNTVLEISENSEMSDTEIQNITISEIVPLEIFQE